MVRYKELYLQKCREVDTLNKKIVRLQALIEENKEEENKEEKEEGEVRRQNIGEKDEVWIIKYIYAESKSESYDSLTQIFGAAADNGIVVMNPITEIPYDNVEEIRKSPPSCKADLCVKLKKTNVVLFASIKSNRGAPPAIINHTHRNANVFKNYLKEDVSRLDVLVNEYRDKRRRRYIGEDVKLMTLDSMNNVDVKKSVIRMLEYFMFDGTGSHASKVKANSMLLIQDDRMTFVDCRRDEDRKKYVIDNLHLFVISLREKAMPKVINDYHRPWIYRVDGKLKGCLHVRLCKA